MQARLTSNSWIFSNALELRLQSSPLAPNLRIQSLEEERDVNTHLSGVSWLKTETMPAGNINELLKAKCALAGQGDTSGGLRNWGRPRSFADSFFLHEPYWCFQKRWERVLRMDHWDTDLGKRNISHAEGIRFSCISPVSPRERKCLTLWGIGQQTPSPLGHWWKHTAPGRRKRKKGSSWGKVRNMCWAHYTGKRQKACHTPETKQHST